MFLYIIQNEKLHTRLGSEIRICLAYNTTHKYLTQCSHKMHSPLLKVRLDLLEGNASSPPPRGYWGPALFHHLEDFHVLLPAFGVPQHYIRILQARHANIFGYYKLGVQIYSDITSLARKYIRILQARRANIFGYYKLGAQIFLSVPTKFPYDISGSHFQCLSFCLSLHCTGSKLGIYRFPC